MKWKTLLTELPERPQMFGQFLSIGKDRGDMHWNDITSFAGTGTAIRKPEHQYAWAYQDPIQKYIADQLTPEIGVSAIHTQNKYFQEDTFYNDPDRVEMTRTSEPSKVVFSTREANIDLSGRALAVEMSYVDKKDAIAQYGSEKKYRAVCIEVLKRLILLHREKTVADLFQTQSNFASGYYGTVGSGVWDQRTAWSGTQALPMQDTEIATQGHFGDLNGASATDCLPLLGAHTHNIFGCNVSYELRNKVADVKGAVSITSKARGQAQPAVLDQALKQYFDKEVIVGRAIYNDTPATPDTFTPTYIWADYAIMTTLGESLGGATLSPAFAKTVVLDTNDLPHYKGWMVKSVDVPLMGGGLGGEIVVVAYWATEMIFSQKLGWNLKVS